MADAEFVHGEGQNHVCIQVLLHPPTSALPILHRRPQGAHFGFRTENPGRSITLEKKTERAEKNQLNPICVRA